MPLFEDWKEAPKLALTRLGAYCSQPLDLQPQRRVQLPPCRLVAACERVGRPASGAHAVPAVRPLAAEVGDRAVLYMEFGVHAGVSIRYWSQLLTNPAAKLHGFDSFVGLPHDWTLEGHPRGYFSTEGAVPVVDDPRVEFFAGWFEDTLPAYEWPEHDVLVVMVDADLYSSTTTVLAAVRDHLVPGSFLYFDQLHHRADELRAFAELIDEHRDLHFRIVGATRELSSVLFQRID